MDDRTRWRQRAIVLFLFFGSGSAGLMYQVVWLRMLARTFGVTIYATATVVAAFMAGLALGSYYIGRIVDRRRDPLRVYGLLELAIGGSAILVPILLAAGQPIFTMVHHSSAGNEILTSIVRVVVAFLVLLLPTTLMGGTLPVLTTFLARRDSLFGRSFGLLYGLNTAGAVAGVLLSGFVTIGAFGERATIGLGVLVNFAVGGMALGLARSEGPRETAITAVSEQPLVHNRHSEGVRRAVLIGFGLSGFTALAYEIVWTRQLILFLKTSVYAFSGMLSVFLVGIALGSLVISRIVDRLKSPVAAFAILELAVGILTAINLVLFVPLDGPVVRRMIGLGSVIFATVMLVLPLTFLFGMIAPVAAVCYAGSSVGTGGAIGRLYSANTIGCILGSLVTGFLLVPSLGATRTMIILAFMNLVLAIVFLFLERGAPIRWRGIALAGVGAAALLLIIVGRTDPFRTAVERRIEGRIGTTWIPVTNAALPPSQKIFAHVEGIEATLTAFEINEFKQLWLNGVGMTFMTTATKLIAHLPILTSEQPKEFLAIAFGMGTTIRSASRYPGLHITAVDLVPQTFDVFSFYHPDAPQVLATGRVNLVTNDGRNFLLMEKKKYDVITVDPAPPIWSAGTVNLYSQEFFRLAKTRLTETGSFCLWFPGGTEDEVKSLIRTFAEIFPNGSIWSGPHNWGWYLIGTLRPIDWATFDRKLAALYTDSSIYGDIIEYDRAVATKEQFRGMYMWSSQEFLEKEGGRQYPLVTDDHPYTEFPLWRYLSGNRKTWHPRSTWVKSP